MSDKAINVLFLCSSNSARSIIAEAILNREGRGRFRAYSAGSRPAGEVHPSAIDILKTMNFDISFARPKSWEEFDSRHAPRLDFVFTVCDQMAGETCPAWPGQPMTAHWGIPDPTAVEGNDVERHVAFADVFRMMNNRITVFSSLPITGIDRLALQESLDGIGRTER